MGAYDCDCINNLEYEWRERKAQLSSEGTTSDLISRQEAIDALKHNQDVYSHNFHDDPIDKYTTAIIATDIDTLVNLPTIQPQSTTGQLNDGAQSTAQSTDLIDRQQAIDALDCINGVEEVLRSLPSVQPERKKGEWLPDNNNAYEMRFICSCCKESEVVPTIGFTKYKPLWDFCPNCGADMRGEKDG